MKLSLFEIARYRHLKKIFIFCLAVVILPYAAICTPIYHVINSNILLYNSPFSLLLDLLMDLLSQLYYWGAFAILIYMAFRLGLSHTRSLIGLFACAVLVRYVTNLIAGYITVGFPTAAEFYENDFWPMLFDIALDLVLIGILYLILRSLLTRCKLRENTLIQSVFPLKKIFTLQNPVQKATLFAAILPAAARILSRIIFDIFIGPPANLSDLITIVIYYMLDLLGIVIGILVITMILNRLYLKEMLAKAEDCSVFDE